MCRLSHTIPGQFYEFHRDQEGNEIGRLIPRLWALYRVRRSEDVYTPRDSDARSLAKDVQKGKADWEGAHDFGYFPHYHPAGNHEEFGHVFYGYKNYRLGENRRT